MKKTVIGLMSAAALCLLSNSTAMAGTITNPLPGLDRLGYGYNVLETEDYDPVGADMHDLIEQGEYDSYQIRNITLEI